MAPVQYLLVGFDKPDMDKIEGGHFAGFRAANDAGLLRVISIRVAYKDVEGNAAVEKVSFLSEEEQVAVGVVVGGLIGYGAAGEAGAEVGAAMGIESMMEGPGPVMQALRDEILDSMPNDSAAVLLVIEHLWVDSFIANLAVAGGFVLRSGFITAEGLMNLGAAIAEEGKLE